jgi:hypothetical protein
MAAASLGIAAGDGRGEGGVVLLRVRIGGHNPLAVQVDGFLHAGDVRVRGDAGERGQLPNKRNLLHKQNKKLLREFRKA